MPIFTEDEVRDAIRIARTAAGGNAKWAAIVGVSPAFVSGVLMGRKRPSHKVATSVGFERMDRRRAHPDQSVMYRRI